MFDSFALLVSDAYQALGYPNREHLDPADLTRAAHEALAFFSLDAQLSEFARSAKTVPLYANSREFLVNNADDLMMPGYIERRVSNDEWQWIPFVRDSVLEEWRLKGFAAATFERDGGQIRVRLSYDPTGAEHRLRYYTSPTIAGDRDDPLPIPSQYGFMLTHKAVINAVPMMLARSSKLDEPLQLKASQLEALSAIVGHAQSDLGEWKKLWKEEKTKDRNAHGRMRRPLVPRGW